MLPKNTRALGKTRELYSVTSSHREREWAVSCKGGADWAVTSDVHQIPTWRWTSNLKISVKKPTRDWGWGSHQEVSLQLPLDIYKCLHVTGALGGEMQCYFCIRVKERTIGRKKKDSHLILDSVVGVFGLTCEY